MQTNIRQLAISDLSNAVLNELKTAINGLQILDIDNVHESFLPWLAWWFRAEQWSDSWPIAQQRTAVKGALSLFRYKGTPWAISRAVELIGFTSNIVEYHEQIPCGENGTFLLQIMQVDSSLTQTDLINIRAAVDSSKRASAHYTMSILLSSDTINSHYLAGTTGALIAEVEPYTIRELVSEGSINWRLATVGVVNAIVEAVH
ncbi:phage tail protein I [Shewanella halifaxensis]|uniref:phage tail protein I n=1 Tax=Shewanella halifaxensis TaxID=271098 RepID=UPI0013A68137|nr:phage tail protein I [Shewanella halifaxensis]